MLFLKTTFKAALLCCVASTSLAQEITESDLAALRYFITAGDSEAVAAETQRLKQAFPTADIDAVVSDIRLGGQAVDTTEIWQAINDNRFDDARARIAEVRAQNPSWSPEDNMLTVLDQREGQTRFDTAFDAGDLSAVMEAAFAFPSIMTCGRINNAWRLAELQVAEGLKPEAVSTYASTLESCRQPDVVVATLQKSASVGTKDDFARLFGIARAQNPDLVTRLAALEDELRPIVEAPATPASTPSPRPSKTVKPKARPTATAQRTTSGNSLTAAAQASQRGDWPACLRLTQGVRSAEGLTIRGWCAKNMQRPLEAVAAFDAAITASRNADTRRGAAYGAILTYLEIERPNAANAVSQRVRLTGAQKSETDLLILQAFAAAAFNKRRYHDALAYTDRIARRWPLDRGMAMLRALSLERVGKRRQAFEQFQAIHKVQPDADTRRALLRLR